MPKKTRTKCKLACPKCHAEWAEISFGPKGEVYPKDVKILLGYKKVLKDGDELKCSICNYPHTTWDLALAIAEGNAKK